MSEIERLRLKIKKDFIHAVKTYFIVYTMVTINKIKLLLEENKRN